MQKNTSLCFVAIFFVAIVSAVIAITIMDLHYQSADKLYVAANNLYMDDELQNEDNALIIDYYTIYWYIKESGTLFFDSPGIKILSINCVLERHDRKIIKHYLNSVILTEYIQKHKYIINVKNGGEIVGIIFNIEKL